MEIKPLSEDELRAARREYAREWRAAHPEKVREYQKRYRESHPQEVRAYKKKWYEQNRDKVREYNKAYWQKRAASHGKTEQAD